MSPMSYIAVLYKTILDALFPVSAAEAELFSYSPEEVLLKLSSAPDFSGLAVSAGDALLMDSVFAYKDERVAKLVWNVKYKKSAHAVAIGGYALLQKLQAGAESRVSRDTRRALLGARSFSPLNAAPKGPSKSLSAPACIILPMPITSKRRKERGYNQCELLVDEIQKLAGENKNGFIFEKNLLVRTHHAARQTLKGRTDRLESAKGIFGVNEEVAQKFLAKEFKDFQIIIIDDVITTGSTMKEAIDMLKKAGFDDVRGLSLAH